MTTTTKMRHRIVTRYESVPMSRATNPPLPNVYRYEPIVLLEEPPIGTLIIDLASKLGLNLDTSEYKFRFYSPTSVAAHYFLIDQLTGHVKTQRTIDREYLCEAKICGPCATNNCTLPIEIVAALPNTGGGGGVGDGSSVSKQKFLSFDVLIEDKNEFAPQFPKSELTLNVSEAAPVNFQIPLEPATDRDSQQTVITYSLAPLDTSNSSLAYLNSKLKLITSPYSSQLSLVILEPFDYELIHEYTFKLLATDNGMPPLTGTCLITLKIIDVNDNLPIFDRQEYEYRVDEGVQPGTRLIRVHATDKDDGLNGLVTYSFGEQTKTDFVVSNFFSIDENTGWISAKAFLDYEHLPKYRFTVKAQDHGANSMPVYATVTIYLNDLNDNAPTINLTVPEDMFTFKDNKLLISEWTPPTSFLAQIIVNDLDSNLNGQVKIELHQYEKRYNSNYADSNEVNIFDIEPLYKNIYSLILKEEVDRETCSEYELILKATDSGSPPLSTVFVFQVVILDENDNKPEFLYRNTDDFYLFQINEGSSQSTELIRVGKVDAHDNDAGVNSKLTYEIEDDNTNMTNVFKINKDTGEIYALSNELDREFRDMYEFKVKCKDGGIPQLESETRVVVKLLDVNDNAPKFTQEIYVFNVYEDLNPFMKFGQVNATDLDEPLTVNSQIKYEIKNTSNAYGTFGVNRENGELYLLKKLDYEVIKSYEFEVVAYDMGIPVSLNSSALVRINVMDVNDNAPQVLWPLKEDLPLVFDIERLFTSKNLDINIFQINATDLDSNENGKLRYFIEKQQKILTNTFDMTTSVHLFECDSNKGIVKGLFLKKRKMMATSTYDDDESLLGVYSLQMRITDSAKLNPLDITTNIFIVLNTNKTQFNEEIDFLKAFFTRNDKKPISDRRVLNLKNFIDNYPDGTTDQYLSSELNGSRRFSDRLFEKTSKLITILIIFSSIMFISIILSIFVIACYRRQKKILKQNNGSNSKTIKEFKNDDLVNHMRHHDEEEPANVNLKLKDNTNNTDLNTSSEEQAALINTNSPASSLLSNNSTRPSMKESVISNQTVSTTSMCNTNHDENSNHSTTNCSTFKISSPSQQQKYTTLPTVYKSNEICSLIYNSNNSNDDTAKRSSLKHNKHLNTTVRTIHEKNEINYASSESTDEYMNDTNESTPPEYFFKNDKEYKTFLNKQKINCKHLIITNKANKSNECFL